jgi:LPS sulfotransferase NodH
MNRSEKVRIALGRKLDVTFTNNPFRDLKKRFVIANSPRTGSHWLCEGLLAHGAVVDEYFNVENVLERAGARAITRLEDYCGDVLREFAIDGVFGVQGGLQVLTPLLCAKEFPEFADQWRFVYLKRENTLRQAISRFIARETGVWQSYQDGERTLEDGDFDGAAIAALKRRCEDLQTFWEETFEAYGIEPLRVTYEQLLADKEAVCARVAAYLDLQGPPITDARFLHPPLERQSTSLNRQWARRFRIEGWASR